MSEIIEHYANLYKRGVDQFDSLLPETIIELHEKVNREYDLIPYDICFVAEELNDYELLKHKL